MNGSFESAASPFGDPKYGREAELGGHVIHSNPTWSLEDNQKPLTGWVGAFVVFAGLYVTATLRQAPHPEFIERLLPYSAAAAAYNFIDQLWDWRHVLILMGIFVGMFLTETLVFRTHRRHFDFENPRTLDGAAWERIIGRWLALLFCIVLFMSLYVFLGEYNFHHFDLWGVLFEGKQIQPPEKLGRPPELYEVAFHYYGRYILFLAFAMPALWIFSLPYFWMVERYARPNGPVDEFLVLWLCLKRFAFGVQSLGSPAARVRAQAAARRGPHGLTEPGTGADMKSAIKNPHVINLLRGLAVKGFWVPLMMLWALDNWQRWEHNTHLLLYAHAPVDWGDPHAVAHFLRELHFGAFSLIIVLDLSIAVVDYIASMRLLDTQVTTAEPTLLGWVVALACYPPFNMQVTPIYFYYPGEHHWDHMVSFSPVWSILVSLGILFLMGTYTWATFAFGLRFSNLTNRGVICCGPYRWVRHPAYICKNSSWWLQSMPFFWHGTAVEIAVVIVHLAALNGIYFLRAWTEERHLRREPHYQEYCRKVPYRFIPGIW